MSKVAKIKYQFLTPDVGGLINKLSIQKICRPINFITPSLQEDNLWSFCIDLENSEGSFMLDEAPHDKLRPGVQFAMFNGRKAFLIGMIVES